MKKTERLTLILIFSSLLYIGSGATGTYIPPSQIAEPKQSITIDTDFNTVWNKTIAYVGDTFFVIDNVEKDSGLINLSFSASDPRQFIDCGKCNITSGKDSGQTVEEATPQFQFNQCNFTTKLSGKINIIVTKIDDHKTKIKINTRYVVNRLITCPGPHNIPITKAADLTFTSNSTGSFGDLVCGPKNTLETMLIDNISK